MPKNIDITISDIFNEIQNKTNWKNSKWTLKIDKYMIKIAQLSKPLSIRRLCLYLNYA